MMLTSYRRFISAFALALNSSASFSADWLLVDEVTRTQVNLYRQESSYYIDKSSLGSGVVEGLRYELALLQTRTPGKQSSIDQIAVLCEKSSIALAVSVRKMGRVQPNGDVAFEIDFGTPTKLSDFQLTNIDRTSPTGLFTLAARAVCRYRVP
jgi:hypothetical protein